jgi:hypothetical protein
MKLRNIGPMPALFVPEHDAYLDIERGQVVDFEDALAVRLLEQAENWELAEDKPKAKPTADADL